MRWVAWGMLTVCIIAAVMATGDASGFEADLYVDNVERPGTTVFLSGEEINVSVFVHEGGSPVVESFALFTMFPDGSYTPQGETFTSGADGWHNLTIVFSSPYAGEFVFGICDPDLQDGWGGGGGFHLASEPVELLGIATDRQYYAPGDTVWYSVLNEPTVTNVTDVGTLGVYDSMDDLVGSLDAGDAGGFEVRTDLDPGIYEMRSEFGALVGSFVVSDVATFPDRDVYHFGQTLTVQTALKGLNFRIISPTGSVIQQSMSGPTDINLPGSGAPGLHTLLMLKNGLTVFRESIHVSYCDLWADTTKDVYEPGSLVKTYFSARDIGIGPAPEDFEELDLDIVYHTVNGTETVDDRLDGMSGYDTFLARPDVVYGEELWDSDTDNRIEFYLNVSSRTVRRTVPLAFGKPVICVEGQTHFGTDEDIELVVTTGIAGFRPVWWIRTPDGDVTTEGPPVSEGTDPFGRPLLRVGDLVYVALSAGYIVEPVTSPTSGIVLNVEGDGVEMEVETDASGRAAVRLGTLDAGTHTITVSAFGYPGTEHPISVSGEELGITIDGPAVVVADEDVEYSLTATRDGAIVDADLDYSVEFLGNVIDSGVSKGQITVTTPDSEGTVTLTASTVLNGSLVTVSEDVIVTTSRVFLSMASVGSDHFEVAYAIPNASETAEVEFEAFGGSRSGTLTSTEGVFRIDFPDGWTEDSVTITVRAWDDGRTVEGTMVTAMPGMASISDPGEVVLGTTFSIDYLTEPPHGDGVFLWALMTVSDDGGSVERTFNLTSANGTVNVVGLGAGDHVISVSAQYLTSGGIESVDVQRPIHVRMPEEEEGGGFALMNVLALVLAVVILVLLVALAGSQRKVRELKRSDSKHRERAKKLKKRLRDLEELLPTEEGHTIPARRPAIGEREEIEEEETGEEETEQEMEEGAEGTAPTPVDDEVSMATEAPCPMCGDNVYIPAKRPTTVRCAGCSFEFIVE